MFWFRGILHSPKSNDRHILTIEVPELHEIWKSREMLLTQIQNLELQIQELDNEEQKIRARASRKGA